MNINMNTLFFVKDTISKVKTIKQDYHCNERHHKKPKQLYKSKGYNFSVKETLSKLHKVDNFILYSNKRVHVKVIDLVIL